MNQNLEKNLTRDAILLIQDIEKYINTLFFERQDAIRTIIVAILAREHVVLLGPPGTAKSEMTRVLTNCFTDAQTGTGLSFFEYLATSFLTPDELFGPVDLEAYKTKGEYRRFTNGRMAEVEVAFLDECFKASGASLNLLLTLLNERLYHNGRTTIQAPLMSLFGASNELPQGDETSALWDRFLLRVPVDYLTSRWEDMMLMASYPPAPVQMNRQTLLHLQAMVEQVSIDPSIIKALLKLKGALEAEGITASDRRWRKCLRLLRAHALLEGRKAVNQDDLDILRFTFWGQATEIKVVAKQVGRVGNPVVAEYLDVVDSALIVYQNFLQEQPKITDDGERSKAHFAAIGKMKKARDRMGQLSDQVQGRKINTARQRFEAAYLDLIKDVV